MTSSIYEIDSIKPINSFDRAGKNVFHWIQNVCKNILFIFYKNLGCPFEKYANLAKSAENGKIADPETTTPNGCTCNSNCGATVDDGFKLDWCTVMLQSAT